MHQGLQALFNQDNGTGRIQSTNASGFPDAAGSFARWLSRIPADLTRDIKFGFPGSAGFGGTDHFSFVCAGAPGFSLFSDDWDYGRYTSHTTRDTYDKLSFDDLRRNATLTAMLAYLASEDTARTSRQQRTVFPPRRNGQPGAWPPSARSRTGRRRRSRRRRGREVGSRADPAEGGVPSTRGHRPGVSSVPARPPGSVLGPRST